MKKVFESDYYTCVEDSESATATSVWQIDDENELGLLEEIDLNHDFKAWEEYTGFWNDYGVMPGALFHRYTFRLSKPFVYITDTIAYNV